MVDFDEQGDIYLNNSNSGKTKYMKGRKLKFGGFKQLLSNYGKTTHLVRFKKGVFGPVEHVDLNILRGKYLLICCINVPIRTDQGQYLRALIEAYDDLSGNIPFEMVLVPKMRSDVSYNQKAAFYHFCSAFSCLAIPFSDSKTRAYLHSFISSDFLSGDDSAILVHPNGTILQEYDVFQHFFYYSSDWFPFLDTTLDKILTQDELLRSKLDPFYSTPTLLSRLDPTYLFTEDIVKRDDHWPLSLGDHWPLSLSADILQCDPLLSLSRFDAAAETTVTVLDLSRKYVGLYLCINGSIMEQIKTAHDYCVANNQQLEIVLVCMSFYDEPNSYYNCLYKALRHLGISTWFIFDYHSKVCRRMWRIFGHGYLWHGEKLIIIPPDCESAELCGREVITNFGIKEYPFTRTAILRRRLEYFRSLTPLFPSLFNNNNCLIQNGKKFNSKQLQGKNVLLYLTLNERDLDTLLIKYYPEIKAKGWEVVFVPLKYKDRCWNGQLVDRYIWNGSYVDLDEMPWPIMPPSAADKACIKEKLFFPEDENTSYLFAVDKDGKIVSKDVQERLRDHGITESLFADVLELDLAYGLAEMPLFD
ncbi:uncharacterized protein LOC141651819 [Silene latifolia]|uniref:uncharacterized protein LOC141651819 n=1 Tax=Silene latifolia TaxID=37657 RepID=UPI003D77C603